MFVGERSGRPSSSTLPTVAAIPREFWAPIRRIPFALFVNLRRACFRISMLLASWYIPGIVRLVFLGINAHILQPLLQWHARILQVGPQLLHEPAISVVPSLPLVVLVRSRTLRPRESLGIRPRGGCHLSARQPSRSHCNPPNGQVLTFARLAGPRKERIHRGAAMADDVALSMHLEQCSSSGDASTDPLAALAAIGIGRACLFAPWSSCPSIGGVTPSYLFNFFLFVSLSLNRPHCKNIQDGGYTEQRRLS
jgi:hypothetical protein